MDVELNWWGWHVKAWYLWVWYWMVLTEWYGTGGHVTCVDGTEVGRLCT